MSKPAFIFGLRDVINDETTPIITEEQRIELERQEIQRQVIEEQKVREVGPSTPILAPEPKTNPKVGDPTFNYNVYMYRKLYEGKLD